MLGDFHIHSTYSDGSLTIRQIVDLYGSSHFKTISITDHVCESNTFLGKAALYLDKTLRKDNFQAYLDEIQEEGERALKLYGMTVIPGIEITKNSLFNHRSAHIVILGVQSWIAPESDIFEVCRLAQEQEAVSIAAHPVFTRQMEKQTYHLWDQREALKQVIDLWEVASGRHIFPEVQSAKLAMIANSDLHKPQHINSWKTQVDARPEQGFILEALKKQKVNFVNYQISNSHLQTKISSFIT